VTEALITPEMQNFLKCLASDTRQRILLTFIEGQERTVNQVAELLELGQSTASEHLAILKRGGVLKSRKEGKEVYYYPDKDQVLALVKRFTSFLTTCCASEKCC
jgi:ArsR family transcriptional regulator, arsenate/arsenite/antimonite-responsive transcriptional repressor